MNNLHEKSSCCRGKIRRYGGRRRQCTICHRTWSVWKRKRGTKKKRANFSLLFKYFDNKTTPFRKPYLRARIRNTLEKYIQKTKWEKIPSGKLIAIADAMFQRVKRENYAFYYILLRNRSSNKAVIAPPTLLAGTESRFGWETAFDKLSRETKDRISVLVCDGRASLVNLGKRNNWLIQRCHFHLKARISNYASSFYLSRHPIIALKVNKLVDIALKSKSSKDVKEAIVELKKLRDNLYSAGLNKTISGFISRFEYYRTYLKYPDLNIPTTTNAVESLIASIREIQHRARGFASISSLENWIIGYLKYAQTKTCNGYKNQQK